METKSEAAPPQGILVDLIFGGWRAKVVAEVAALDVADALQRHGPSTAVELVERHGIKANPEALERCLRACAAMGIFSEDKQGRFGPTSLSEPLTENSKVSVKKLAQSFAGNAIFRGLTGLPQSLRSGRQHMRDVFGMEWWEYLSANPRELELFGEAMKSGSTASLVGLLNSRDFSNARKVADIGGGLGHLAIALLEKYPNLQGVVLDRPDVVAMGRERMKSQDKAIASRLEYIGGDMFNSVPPADTYIFKHIIHDWDDEHCIRVLRNCHSTMEGDGCVICVDAVVPPMGDTSGLAAKVTDILMLTFIDGKERTRTQWERIYQEAGFRISAITPLADYNGTSIVEGVKA